MSRGEGENVLTGDWKVIEVTLIEICISIRVKWNVIENAFLHFDSLPLYLNRNVRNILFRFFST